VTSTAVMSSTTSSTRPLMNTTTMTMPPSRSSMLTGTPSSTHGGLENETMKDYEVFTLPDDYLTN
jgi:hypothetical protein